MRHQILQTRQRANRKNMQATLAKLGSLLDGGGKSPIGAMTDNALFNAFQRVAAEEHITLGNAPSAMEGTNDDPVEQLAVSNNLFIRKVKLSDPRWYKKDFGPLVGGMEDGTPVALLFRNKRYVCVNGATGKKARVTSSNCSRISEVAYQVYPQFSTPSQNWRDVLRFSLRNCRKDIIAIAIMALLTGILSMATPVITGYLMDTTIPDANLDQLATISIGLFFIYIATLFFNITRSVALTRIQGKVEQKLQSAVWGRLINLPTSFYKDKSSGELATKVMIVERIQKVLTGSVLNALFSSFMVLFNFALLFIYSWKLALVGVAVTAFMIVITLSVAIYHVHLSEKIIKEENRQSSMILQFLAGIEKIKIPGAEFRAFARLGDVFVAKEALTIKSERTENITTVINSGLPILSTMAIFAVLIYTNMSQTLPLGSFIAFNSAYGQFMGGALAISGVVSTVLGIIPMYKQFKPFLEAVPEVETVRAGAVELRGRIAVDHVKFGYDKDGPLVLEDISMEVEPGTMVALVGPSGCGKSTLFRLLLGFEQPFAGEIFYDDRSISEINIQSLRRQLGVVLQNSAVIGGSLFENIVGTKNLTVADARQAAEQAGLAEDIDAMPMGMHTVVQQGGGTLSGGQQQRLVIARAMAQAPKIIFFDEATSALDNKTQEIVTRSLDQLNVTRVVIAHRLSTIINADRIFVLDEGRIAQSGTYEELMKDKEGMFYELASRQQV